MKIAITQRVVQAENYDEPRDALAHDWVRWADSTFPGSLLLPLPNGVASVESWLSWCEPDLIVLSNGNDLGDSELRDTTERAILGWARDRDKRLLGVCRGLQFLNSEFGGSVERSVASRSGSIAHVAVDHPVGLRSSFAPEMGLPTSLQVNSFHDQGVAEEGMADDLVPFAVSEDRIVEGLVHPSEPILAIQWHPERRDPSAPWTTALIRRLVEEGAFWA